MKRGSMLMETVLVMPILLLLIFGILQFAHVWMARQMVAYAAFCAARAGMVARPEERGVASTNAAEIALSWINLADNGQNLITVPGWGGIVGSGTSDNGRSRVGVSFPDGYVGSVRNRQDPQPRYIAATVHFDFPLLIPGMAVNKIIASAARVFTPMNVEDYDFYADVNRRASTVDGDDIDGWPYITLTETCVLPMPYSTAQFPRGAFDGPAIRAEGR